MNVRGVIKTVGKMDRSGMVYTRECLERAAEEYNKNRLFENMCMEGDSLVYYTSVPPGAQAMAFEKSKQAKIDIEGILETCETTEPATLAPAEQPLADATERFREKRREAKEKAANVKVKRDPFDEGEHDA